MQFNGHCYLLFFLLLRDIVASMAANMIGIALKFMSNRQISLFNNVVIHGDTGVMDNNKATVRP